MSLRNEFIHWHYNDFQLGEEYFTMSTVTEDSPWHRERNVAVHTDMVLAQYLARSDRPWTRETLMGAFACVFHDVGKPMSMEICYREDRGEYKRFAGHELSSARMWEDWAVRNWNMLVTRFKFEPEDIFRVGFIIEHHLPWALKDKTKRKNLFLTLIAYGIDTAFRNHLMSDTLGRMSDDMETKELNAMDWCDDYDMEVIGLHQHSALFNRQLPSGKLGEIKPVMFVPIAASGSGKSTYYNTMPMTNTFSLDLMRHELYGDDYAEAFLQSTKDKHFRSQCNDRFREILRKNEDVFLDNTNTSRKNRRFYITEARNRGYHVAALLFPVTFDDVIGRQESRTDKTVPPMAVERQYMGLTLPQLGEFESIHVLDVNL